MTREEIEQITKALNDSNRCIQHLLKALRSAMGDIPETTKYSQTVIDYNVNAITMLQSSDKLKIPLDVEL